MKRDTVKDQENITGSLSSQIIYDCTFEHYFELDRVLSLKYHKKIK